VSKIVGGVQTEVNEYPWQVGITSGSGRSPFCGGSLVSDQAVLTAAHCTQGRSASNTWVLLGEHSLSTNDGQQYVSVCGIKNHPNYNSNTVDNDFAVLILCNKVQFRKEVSTVCLPNNAGQGTSYEGVTATVSGWGTLSQGGSSPNVLMEVDVQTMSNSACTSTSTAYSASDITSSMLCASNPGKDSCQGDSGGPLVTQQGETRGPSFFQIGVVSWGYGCAQSNAPGVYARVTNQLGWINSQIVGQKCPAVAV